MGPTARPGFPSKNFTLFHAAPVLSSGWTLLGEMSKFVPCSPQRFVALSSAGAPRAVDLTRSGADLTVRVLGLAGENVEVTLVAPSRSASSPLDGTIVVLEVEIGSQGEAEIAGTSNGDCVQHAVQ